MSTSHAPATEKALLEDTHDQLFINNRHSSRFDALPTIYITSYGHRLGPLLPTPHISFDLRTLPNPPKNIRTGQKGISKPVRDWLFAHSEVQRRFDDICKRIQSRMEEAHVNGEKEIKVGVCCEIGKHRSVAVVEELGQTPFKGWNVVVEHRDVHRKRSRNPS
ncbi:hypothetical protein BDZ97DRAFT_1780043 [Flammula alnicola]|nr:hypothetical protein BDZ97DRAFT_1780043 [Flammula alnicola]